ncbi:hypothetical protein EON63_17135 [archaeon]|nr:MAG: hypothetical protein EON63_17135 [archaeon]
MHHTLHHTLHPIHHIPYTIHYTLYLFTASEADANGRIGQLLLSSGMVQDSVPYLKAYSALAADLGM